MHTRIMGDKNMYTIQEKLRGEYKSKPEEQKNRPGIPVPVLFIFQLLTSAKRVAGKHFFNTIVDICPHLFIRPLLIDPANRDTFPDHPF